MQRSPLFYPVHETQYADCRSPRRIRVPSWKTLSFFGNLLSWSTAVVLWEAGGGVADRHSELLTPVDCITPDVPVTLCILTRRHQVELVVHKRVYPEGGDVHDTGVRTPSVSASPPILTRSTAGTFDSLKPCQHPWSALPSSALDLKELLISTQWNSVGASICLYTCAKSLILQLSTAHVLIANLPA